MNRANQAMTTDMGGSLRMAGLLMLGMLGWAGLMLLGTVAIVSDLVPSL